jgi:hypothetical protein
MTVGVGQVVECWPRKYEALSLLKKQQKKKLVSVGENIQELSHALIIEM